MLIRLAVALLLAVAAPAVAADPSGRWLLNAGDTPLMLFEVARTSRGWTGAWQRPAHFESDGDSFSRVTGPAVLRTAHSAREVPGGIELTFNNPKPDEPTDVFVIRGRDAATADLSYVAFGEEPATLKRAVAGRALGGWDATRTYVRSNAWPTDPEMTAIFDADQAARENPTTIDWTVLRAEDATRRALTQTLLDAGRLRSADDFYHAAYVFQHGDAPDDYLKAHALATVAASRGKPKAAWIAAATLDRYLQTIGQPQIYGTQFQERPDKSWTQEPYRRDVVSNALRKATGVPGLLEQEKQRKDWERRFATTKKR